MYTVPSSKDNETISVPTSLRDSLSCLDVVWADMFETEDINPATARQQQIDFLRGAPPKFLTIYTSVNQPTVVPLVERDGFNDLIQLVENRKRQRSPITDVSLRYQSGSGGSTLAMQVLWHFRKDLRCARAIDSDLNTKLSDLSKQVLDLFLLSNEEHANQDRRTVLLLLDTKEKTDNNVPIKNVLCNNLMEEIHKRGINTDTPVVIILNCIPKDFTLTDTMTIPPNPTEEETKQFKDKILQLIRLQTKSQRKITTIKLHHKESGGSTLDSNVLSDLGEELTLIEPIQTDISAEDFKKTLKSRNKIHLNTLPLLYDYKDDKSLCCLITNLLKCEECPAFIIINAVSKRKVQEPDDVKLKMELLPGEKAKFAEKRQDLENKYKEMSQKLHAFNIMQRGFQREDAENVITEEIANHIKKDSKSTGTRLLSFLALINSYVPGSHLSKLLCMRFIGKSEWPTDDGKPSLEMILKPFEDLIVSFSDGEQKADYIRLAHPMIADACLKRFTEHNVKKSVIALDFLNSMVKSNEISYEQICKSMLVTRPEGLIEKKKFSKLILDILNEGKQIKPCIDLLNRALNLFSKDPFYPQALSRLYYITVKERNKFEMAEQWATEAIKRDNNNSYLKDTLGQVFKNDLTCQLKKKNRDKNVCLSIAKSAIDAFKAESEAAEVEINDHKTKSNDKTKFNYRGNFYFLQVCNEIHEYRIDVKDDVESKYDFFEWFLAFSKPCINEEEPDYFSKDVEECYMRYFTQEEQTNEKKMRTLHKKKMHTFAGLLCFLKSDINEFEEYWNEIKNPKSDNEEHIVPNVLANIILSQFDKPCENLQDLQARLQELWRTEEKHRSPEFYLLILLLFWPDEAQPVNQDSPNLENCVQYMSQSYERKYQKYLYGRYLVPLFFLGKGSCMQRLVHTKLQQIDLELLTEGDENEEVSYLQRINGEVKNHQVFVVRDGQQIQVSPYKRASVHRDGRVSFYLGFTIEGPVAYNIRYDENN